jgi:hypothetical protein
MKTDRTDSRANEKGIKTVKANTLTINTGGSAMKGNGNTTIDKDKGEEVIEVVRSSFSEKDLLNVHLIDPHRLKFSMPSSLQSIMGSQDLNISCDVEQNLLSFKLDFSNPIPKNNIESTLRFLNLANTESCSYRYMCNPDSGKVSLRLDHPITHPSLQKSIAKRILMCMYTDSIHMALMLHWLLTQGREPTELYTRYRFALENTHNKIRSTPDLGTVVGSYSIWDVYEEIGSAMERLYNVEPIAKHLKCGKLVYHHGEIEEHPMRLLIGIHPRIQALTLRLTDCEPVPENKVGSVIELLSRLNLTSNSSHLTLNPKDHWIHLHQGLFLEKGEFMDSDLDCAVSTLGTHAEVFFRLIDTFMTSELSARELVNRMWELDHTDPFPGSQVQ